VQTYHVWNDESGFGWLFWLCLATFSFNWYLTRNYLTEGFQWNIIWSLAVEEQFYFFYPLVLRSLKTRRKVLIFLSLVVVSGLLFRAWIFTQWGPPEGSVSSPAFIVLNRMASFANFDQIALGCLLYFVQETWGSWLEARRSLSLFLMVFGLGLCFYLCDQPTNEGALQIILGPTALALGCALVLLGGLHVRWMGSDLVRTLSWPGKLSYGFYLWHPTITFLLMPFLMVIGGFGCFVYLWVAVFFFAFLSYRFFEVPVNGWIRSWFGLKASTTA
jgi:peptidoglycan/LPS O-acetylase OafA/YrhL